MFCFCWASGEWGETGDASGNGGYGTDPTTADTDGDGLTDGMEVNGYDLTYMKPQPDGSVVQVEVKGLTSDPTDPENKDQNGIARDLDHDGMSDYEEKNPTLAFATFTAKMNETEIENQFNPFVKENIPPMLYDNGFTIEVDGNVFDASYTHVKVRPFDISGVNRVEARIKGSANYEIMNVGDSGWFEVSLVISKWQVLNEFTVQIKIVDEADNILEFKHTEKGVIGQVASVIVGIWNLIVDSVAKAWEAVKAAVDFIWEWIKFLITAALDLVIQPVLTAIENWLSGINNAVQRIMTVGDTDDIDVNLLLNTMFVGGFIALLSALAFVLIYVVESLLIIFLNMIPGVGAATTIISEALMQGAKFAGKFAFNVAISTGFVMFGELLSMLIPHDDPVHQAATATGALFISLAALALSKYIAEAKLGKGDALGISLTLIGFTLSIGSIIFGEYAHLMSVVGAILAAVGLAISLVSPDMPQPIGFLDEGISSILTGWSIYNAVKE